MMQTIDLLIVEDNPGDVDLIREALSESSFSYRIAAYTNGESAIAFLRESAECPESKPFPDLAILDLNLPGLSGREVLAAIRREPRTACLPVVIMTSSCSPKDIEESYRLHANCYVNKPLDFEDFMRTIRHIEQFWFQTALRPPKPGA